MDLGEGIVDHETLETISKHSHQLQVLRLYAVKDQGLFIVLHTDS